jgi:23S rRNA (guanosine2251-2'-O)-methyltransferase
VSTEFIYGFHAVQSRIRSHPESVIELYVDAERNDQRSRNLRQLAEEQKVRVLPVDRARLDGMSGFANNQGCVARVKHIKLAVNIDDVLAELKEPALLLVLDGVQDPHNLGACMRLADAMGAHAVIAPKDRAVGLNATVRKVASGAAEVLPFIPVTNLARSLRELKDQGIWIVGAAGEAEQTLYQAKLTGPIAWVMGAEGEGLRRLTREHCDELVKIPMLGSVDSLNVSVASGICLFETRRQRQAGVKS